MNNAGAKVAGIREGIEARGATLLNLPRTAQTSIRSERVRASERMLKAKAKQAGRRITVGEDKAYDTADM